MKTMNTEIKKVVTKVRDAQEKLQKVLKNQSWIEEARKYAERQGQEVKKLLTADVEKVKTFLERERKELERFQKEVPGEVKKIKSLLKAQSKELSRLLVTVRKGAASNKKKTAAGTTKKKATKKATGTKKKAGSSVSSTGSSA